MDDASFTLDAAMLAMGARARDGAQALRLASAETRTAAIEGMARAIREDSAAILAANAEDVAEFGDRRDDRQSRLRDAR